MKTIAIIGSCDTKFKEIAYMRELIEAGGMKALVIDVATGPSGSRGYDISREEVALFGGMAWEDMITRTKGEKIAYMAEAAAGCVCQLYLDKGIDGVIAVGGLQNTVIATTAMQRLPIGFPKVISSTVASGRRTFESLMGGSDIVVIPSICDFTGLNLVTRQIIQNVCACCIGMIEKAGGIVSKGEKPVVAVSLMGITNTGACAAIEELERCGVEAIGFHTTGVGGATMEQMAADGLIDGILDLTLHEITSGYFGGGFSYGPKAAERLLKASSHRVPMVICPGGLDFVDFSVGEFPPRMEERVYMMHNGTTAHIKILPEEAEEVAKTVIQRLKTFDYKVKLLLPTEGMRHNTGPGEELYDKKVDDILINRLTNPENSNIEVITVPGNLDTKAWGIQAAGYMIEALKERKIL